MIWFELSTWLINVVFSHFCSICMAPLMLTMHVMVVAKTSDTTQTTHLALVYTTCISRRNTLDSRCVAYIYFSKEATVSSVAKATAWHASDDSEADKGKKKEEKVRQKKRKKEEKDSIREEVEVKNLLWRIATCIQIHTHRV